MKARFYLLMTVLFGILSFNLSEARVMDFSAGETIGTPSWSVTIPVKRNMSIAKKKDEIQLESFSFGEVKTPKSNNKSTSGSSKGVAVGDFNGDGKAEAVALPKKR